MTKDEIYSVQDKKKGISRFKVDLLIYGLIVLTAFSSLYWQHAPQIFLQETLSKKYLIANVIRGFSVTSIPIMLLLLGYFMTRIRKIGIFQAWRSEEHTSELSHIH